jgi:hypothetical protein
MHMSKYCFVKRQTQKADNDTAYASSDWPSVMKQTFLCNFLKYHNSFFSTVIHSSEHNYWQSFFYLILKVFLHTSVRLTLLLWTQLISVTWTVNLFCHKHCHIMTSNSHVYCVNTIFKMREKSRKVNFLIAIIRKWILAIDCHFYCCLKPHICSSASFLLLFFRYLVLSSTLKTRLNHSFFLSTTRTKSLCWDHHRESLDCRPVRSFVSIHCHQQHHHIRSIECVTIFSHSRIAARVCLQKEQNFDTSVTALALNHYFTRSIFSRRAEYHSINFKQVFLTYRVT